ncbi:MAG: nucleoside hydrolase [Alphaproteobacteria bacterium]|nr:nucleoside hydrolase [Alphaproteobacteria bacterium]
MPTPIILDCDPGIDDFIAIMMILAAPERFSLLGITVSGGNVPINFTAQNALKACELAERRDVKVYAGCPAPLLRPLVLEEGVHGVEGLKYVNLPTPKMLLQSTHAVDFLIDTLLNYPQKVTLATTGPLTNVALAIVREPRILDNIEEIVTMGGSMCLGNITPAAEYNFYADPEAAHILFTSGKKITAVSIDVTHQALTTSEWMEKLAKMGNPAASAVSAMVQGVHEYDTQNFETAGGALHDPCVIAYFLDPSLFKGTDVHVEIDTSHGVTRGRSTIDRWGKRGLTPNAHVFNEFNASGFFDLLTDLLFRYKRL